MALFHFGTLPVDFSKYVGTYVHISLRHCEVRVMLRHASATEDSHITTMEQNDVISAIEMATLMNVPVEIESIEQGV